VVYSGFVSLVLFCGVCNMVTLFSVKRQVFFAGMLESSDIVATGFESWTMADYAVHCMALKSQYLTEFKGCHIVFSVV